MLYIMRHGQTDWNIEYRLQGVTDIPLNAAGRAMACSAAVAYRDIHFDICYVSPLARARETAELFLEGRDVPIVVDARVREACFGEYEGEKSILEHPDWMMYRFFKDPENYVADRGAESFEELFARADDFIANVLKPELRAGKDVLVVGHGAMSLAIINRIKRKPLKDYWAEFLQNCELTEVHLDKAGETTVY